LRFRYDNQRETGYFPARSQPVPLVMDEIREKGPAGRVLATSLDGSTFVTPAGVAFAQRVDEVFRMADGSVGTLIGAVVFVQNEEGLQVAAYWLAPIPDSSE
jgi:hypothetical protein